MAATETGTKRAAQRRRSSDERLADEILASLGRSGRLLDLTLEVLNRAARVKP